MNGGGIKSPWDSTPNLPSGSGQANSTQYPISNVHAAPVAANNNTYTPPAPNNNTYTPANNQWTRHNTYIPPTNSTYIPPNSCHYTENQQPTAAPNSTLNSTNNMYSAAPTNSTLHSTNNMYTPHTANAILHSTNNNQSNMPALSTISTLSAAPPVPAMPAMHHTNNHNHHYTNNNNNSIPPSSINSVTSIPTETNHASNVNAETDDGVSVDVSFKLVRPTVKGGNKSKHGKNAKDIKALFNKRVYRRIERRAPSRIRMIFIFF